MRLARPKQGNPRPEYVSQSMGWTIKFGPSGTNEAGGLGGTGATSRAVSGLSPSLRAAESPGNLGAANLVGGRQETPC